MKRHRFYMRPITESAAELTGSEAHHASSVLRYKPGDILELFDGAGTLATAEIQSISPGKIPLTIRTIQTHPCPNRCQVVIACSVAKGERFDQMIRQCTELGVDRICPVRFERTVKMARGGNVTERYKKLAIAGAKQCERLFLPRIDPPGSLAQTLDYFAGPSSEISILYGSCKPGAPSVLQQMTRAQDQVVFIGPEGGLTASEEELLVESGAQEVRFTDTVLRIETAAVTAAAILCAKRDDIACEQA